MEEINYLSISNNAKIISCSSQAKSCGASNVLSPDRKTIWLSESGIPQNLIIDLSNLSKKSKDIKCFGIYCWHAYNTNPKMIELYFSKDNKSYIYFGKLSISLKPGTQYFAIDPVDTNIYKSLKIVIKETYGGLKTYINQVYLYDEIPEIENKKSINESKKSFSTSIMNSSRQLQTKKNLANNLRNELLEDNKKIDNNNENKHFDSDSEDSMQNLPQKLYNFQDLSRISKLQDPIKPMTKKESFDNYSNKMDKNEIEEKVLDGISMNNNSILNNNHFKANSIDHPIVNKISKTTEDKNSKTLEDQLKDMESHLMKLKLDGTTDDTLKSKINCGKLKSFTITDDKFSNEKENLSLKLNSIRDNIKANMNYSTINNSENQKLFIGDEFKKSNSNYSLLTKAHQAISNDDKILKLESIILDLNTKYENLQEEVNNLKKSKASVTDKNMDTIINECKKFISSMIINNTKNNEKCNNQYSNANYNQINENNRGNTSNNNNQKLNYSSDTGNDSNNKSNDNNINHTEIIEKKLNTMLDVKFNSLVKNIEEKIKNSFLQPSLNNIEKSLKSNIEDLRDKISSISNTIPTKSHNKVSSQQRPIFNSDDTAYEPEKSINNKTSKIESIQSIAEKLHAKLNEKEKKLSLLQQQTNYYLKEKKNLLSSPTSNISDNY